MLLSLPRSPTSPRAPRASPPRPGAAATASRRRARHRDASSTCQPRRSTRRSSPAASSPQIATDSVATEREKGVLGVNLTSRDVKECNKRGCFHIHGQAQGGATPELIAFVAEDARLRSRLLEALDTQLQARASRVPPSSYASPPPPAPPCFTRATSRPRLTPLSRACRRLCRSSSTRCRFCSASCASARGATRPATPRSRPRRRPTPRMRLRAGAACVVKQCVVKGGTLRVVWYGVQKREKVDPSPGPGP